MKKLLILFALFLGLGIANAQTKKTNSKTSSSAPTKATVSKNETNSNTAKNTKPSLDETVKYINDVLRVSLGAEGDTDDKVYFVIVDQEFSLEKYVYKYDVFSNRKKKYLGIYMLKC